MDAIHATEYRLSMLATAGDLPPWLTLGRLADFLHKALQPYHDPLDVVQRGINDALSPGGPLANFILVADADERPTGAAVVLRTGMGGYVPENLLLFIAVDPDHRGRGLGQRMLERVIQECDGDVKLHVEYDNPAKRLYERVGFQNKYADMRFAK
ncbi:MAG: GNAT family N-acetyltransferase [Phycisphaerae bacterium]|nr:GNAT family N-acetyltransferase [Phycisphaerae bacterium]